MLFRFVSKVGHGIARGNNSRQFIFVNARPVDLPEFTKALNSTWRLFEMKHKSACVLNIELPHGSYDVNVTPDKRTTFLVFMKSVVEALTSGLRKVWEPSRGTFSVNQSVSSLIQQQIARSSQRMADEAEASPAASSVSSLETLSSTAPPVSSNEDFSASNGDEPDSTLTKAASASPEVPRQAESPSKAHPASRVVDIWNDDVDDEAVDSQASIAAAVAAAAADRASFQVESGPDGHPLSSDAKSSSPTPNIDPGTSGSTKAPARDGAGSVSNAPPKTGSTNSGSSSNTMATSASSRAASWSSDEESDDGRSSFVNILKSTSSSRKKVRASPVVWKKGSIATQIAAAARSSGSSSSSRSSSSRISSSSSSSGRSSSSGSSGGSRSGSSSSSMRSALSTVRKNGGSVDVRDDGENDDVLEEDHDEVEEEGNSPASSPAKRRSSMNRRGSPVQHKRARASSSAGSKAADLEKVLSGSPSRRAGAPPSRPAVENVVVLTGDEDDTLVEAVTASQNDDLEEDDSHLRLSFAPDSIPRKLEQRLRFDRYRAKASFSFLLCCS